MMPTPAPRPAEAPAPPPAPPPLRRSLPAADLANQANPANRAMPADRATTPGPAPSGPARRDPEGTAGRAPPPLRGEPLRQRVIALENLVIALLAGATDAQLAQAAAMADFISPRPGHTAHPLTLRAAGSMRSLLDRSDRFRCDTLPPGCVAPD